MSNAEQSRNEAVDVTENAGTARSAEKAEKPAKGRPGRKPAGTTKAASITKTAGAAKAKPAGATKAAEAEKPAEAAKAAAMARTARTTKSAETAATRTRKTAAAGTKTPERGAATRAKAPAKADAGIRNETEAAPAAAVIPEATVKAGLSSDAHAVPHTAARKDVRTAAAPAASDASATADYDFKAAEEKLMYLQQKIREMKIPVVILLEGWSAAGKGTMAGELLEGLDPRGYKVCINERFPKEEDAYPYLRRYWVNMPRQGNIALFIGGWYERIGRETVRGGGQAGEMLEKAKLMEEMLSRDGAVLLKFFIDISKKEQKRRLTELERKKRTCKLVCKADWEQNEAYGSWKRAYERIRKATDLPGQAWHIVSGEEKRACKRAIYETVIAAFESAIAGREKGDRSWDAAKLTGHEPVEPAIIQRLQMFEPAQALEEDYKSSLNAAQKKLKRLQYQIYRAGVPVVIAFEGWDAAGKGGAIRRLTDALDPRGFTVEPISAPTAEEKEHHHLWRFWTKLPGRGEIRIFDRTWYGRVMVERIEGFCTENQWKRAYDEMNLFEKELRDAGAVICKFWLQIDSEEQLKRFNARQKAPEKQWKITPEDWRNREKWPEYETAVDEMLQKTNTDYAPWTVVEADNKQYARIKVLHTVIDAMEKALKKK